MNLFNLFNFFVPQNDQGDDNDNELTGSVFADTIDGLGGDDKIIGLDGDDTLNGGDGRDTLHGDEGDDVLVGNKGDDFVYGGDDDDLLIWNNGDGSDFLDGGRDDDTVQVNFNTDLVNDDLDNDDTASFGSGDEGIEFARTELNGQTERGLFNLDIRNVETLETNFGDGDDTAQFFDDVLEELKLELDGGDGIDTLDFSQLGEGIEISLLEGEIELAHFENFENVIGTEFRDEIIGNAAGNTLSGLGGNDLIQGRGGRDVLIGGKGDDEVFGLGGNDLLVWNNGDGSDLLDGGRGDDTVQVNFNTDLVNDDLQNNDRATFETGENGVEFARTELNGQTARGLFNLDIRNTETLETNFGGGDDIAEIIGDVLDEIELELDGGDGIDTLDFSQLDEGIEVNLLDGTAGTATVENFENVIGTEFDDTIIANAAGNTVSGLGGNDFIQGRGRSDILIGGKGDDEVFGRNGDDLLVWNNGDGSDLLDGGNGDDRVQINFNTDLVNDDLQNDDVATFEDGPNGVEFARTEVNGQSQFGLFQLDIRDTETVETNFGGGDDTAVLIGSVLEESRLELDGGDGFDVLDLSQLDEGVEVDVENGTVGNLSFENFEKIIGTDFDDIILADDAVEEVEGGDGIDTVDFSEVSEGLTIRQPAEIELAAELAVTAAAAEPERRVVVIDNVENIVGTEFADSIVADASSNTISGLGGNDFIQGRGRSDTLIGGKGDDEVFGGNGDDLLVWNNGDGSDLLDGGNGTDRVQVNFNTDLVNDDLQNDDTARIEDSAEGVAFARTELNGQTERGLFQLDIRNSEVLETNFGGGDDTAEIAGDILPPVVAVVIEEIEEIEAVAALEPLEPIALIPEGSFALELDGGAGTDTLDFSDLANGVFVDLEEDRANGATVVNFENVAGTDFNDVITGDDGDNTIFVSLGNDALDGGDGSDTVDFSKLDEAIEFSLEDQVSGEPEEILAIEIEAAGPVDGTTFENFENVTGTDFNDVITGDDGDNVIRGGKGNDILESGEGADTFLFFEGDTGVDVLLDFEVGVDTLQFATTQDLNPQGLLGLLEQAGDDVELAFGGRTIVIENSEVSDFSADDFSVIEI